MTKRINFKDKVPQLSEEHIKQICRFTDTPYVEGQYQKMMGYVEFKKWYYNKLKETKDSESK